MSRHPCEYPVNDISPDRHGRGYTLRRSTMLHSRVSELNLTSLTGLNTRIKHTIVLEADVFIHIAYV